MNIEELKLVLETVATVTDDAKSVAIWYFVFNYGVSFLLNLLCLAFVAWLANLIVKGIMTANAWAETGRRIAKAWGATYVHSFSSPTDYDVSDSLDKCLAAAKESKK
jgi:cytochrome bd-type quinol oxidase subunit 1